MFVRYVIAGALTLTGLLSSLVTPFALAAQASAAADRPQQRSAARAEGEDAGPADGARGHRHGRHRTHHPRHHHRATAQTESAVHAAGPGAGPAGQASDQAPAQVPGQAPDQTAGGMPDETTGQAPGQATGQASDQPPGQTGQATDQATAHPAGRATPVTPGRLFKGAAFDTCQAPDLATMDAWLAHSDYRAAGIYFGGRARACSSQKYLTPDWVRRTTTAGWNLLPIYVGSQSPCVNGTNKNPYRIDASAPGAQGGREGKDAVAAAQTYGIKPGSPLYLDMEAYDIGNASCAATTLAYVQAWDRQVHAAGYVTGFYSSADSGIRHMDTARRAGAADLPDVLWYARWGVAPNLTHEPSVADSAWTPHARIHQYSGSVTESHGGRSLSIDRNVVDAPVAVVG